MVYTTCNNSTGKHNVTVSLTYPTGQGDAEVSSTHQTGNLLILIQPAYHSCLHILTIQSRYYSLQALIRNVPTPHPPLVWVISAQSEDEVRAASHGMLEVAGYASANLAGEVEGHAL